MYDAVFLDRDGTLNIKAVEGEYITDPAGLVLLPGAADAVRALNQISRYVIVVTNQRGVALGRMTLEDVKSVNRHLQDLLREGGATIDAFYVCPHDVGQCRCRKPDIGLLLLAIRDFPSIRFSSSALVGDSATDTDAADRAGMLGVRLRSTATDEEAIRSWHEALCALVAPR